MENQEELMTHSRAEYIRLARESCTRNLGANHSGKNNNQYKELQKEQKRALSTYVKTETYQTTVPGEDTILPVIHFKPILIRVICCALIFLSVFIIDKFDITIKNFTSATVEEYITSNAGIEEAQNFLVSLYEKVVKK
jgi:hypothetical protein